MTTVQEIKALFDRKVSECQSLGLSKEFCMEQITQAPSLADRFTILEETRCLLPQLTPAESMKCKQDTLEEAIGEEVIEEHHWIPLSAKYPQLKGATDEDVDDYINYQLINEAPFFTPEDLEILKKNAKEVGRITPDMDEIEQEEAARQYYLETYFKNYKMYDRDEAFQDSVTLYQKLKNLILVQEKGYKDEKDLFGESNTNWELENTLKTETIFVTSPRGGHELLSIFSYANNLRKEAFPSDIQETLQRENVEFGFYGVGKEYRPAIARIGEFTGLTWLGDKKHKIKRVIFLDDIISSGDQTIKAIRHFRKTFASGLTTDIIAADSIDQAEQIRFEPVKDPIKFYFASLCKREVPKDWEDARDIATHIEDGEEIANYLEAHTVSIHETLGKESFEKCMIDEAVCEPDKPINCAFAWSVPDGVSDYHIRKLLEEIGRTDTSSRHIRKTLEVEKERMLPLTRFWRSIENFTPEEKQRYAKFIRQNSKFKGYYVQEPLPTLKSDQQEVYFTAALPAEKKEDALEIVDKWLRGQVKAREWGGMQQIDNEHRLGLSSDDSLNYFGYERDKRGLLQEKAKYYWNERKWTDQPTILTERNQKLVDIFVPIMTSERPKSDKDIAVSVFYKIKDHPEEIDAILKDPDSVWDYM